MFFTTQDTFFITTTIVIAVVGLFLAIALFYTIVLLKRINVYLDESERAVNTIAENVREATEKVADMGSYIKIGTQFAQMATTAYQNHKNVVKKSGKRKA